MMKINGHYPNNVGNIYRNQQKKAQLEKKSSQGNNVRGIDRLELSSQARKINELVQQTKDLPEIREEKIARIKEEIANNTYQVPAEKLAAKMLAKDNV